VKPPLAAFGLSGEPVPLEGGQGVAFRVGNVVLKREGGRAQGTHEFAEDEWRATLYERIIPDDFRVPRPVRALDGSVALDGWVAFEWLPGEHSLDRWDDVLAVCDRFHTAVRDEPRPGFLDAAIDPWTTAQRAVWGITPLDVYGGMKHVERLVGALRPVEAPAQLVHSDFTANVLFAPDLSPAVIDVSPWWAPVEYARAVVVGDALLWYGADASLASRVASQYLVRAVLFRKIVDRLFRADEPERLDEDDHYLPVVELALELAR
jgi:uncharacterized protein (TIGR02569 family)